MSNQTEDPAVAGQAPRTERQNHLSSLRMRLQTVGDVPPLPAEEALWLIEELDRAETEIERLTAERDELNKALVLLHAQLVEVCSRHGAERDRLDAHAADLSRQHHDALDECDRLRASLEYYGKEETWNELIGAIAAMFGSDDLVMHFNKGYEPWKIAREALASHVVDERAGDSPQRDTDETTPVPAGYSKRTL